MAAMQKQDMRWEHIVAKMKNQTPTVMHCERYIKWSMPDTGPSPPPIEATGVTSFTGFVSKGAVVYVSSTKETCSVAWLLAWDRPDKYYFIPPCPNKVYVACGPKSVIEKMSDEEIQKKLDDAPSAEVAAIDPITKATVHAKLEDTIGIEMIPIDTALDACFGVAV
ncbi:jasmonate-induced protein homolog [Silene latifolia]|uniref:jasmonate-induced protein homolog n=1 Tax=Silene latifolia TaxID=37657 RepID=UPI003D77D258